MNTYIPLVTIDEDTSFEFVVNLVVSTNHMMLTNRNYFGNALYTSFTQKSDLYTKLFCYQPKYHSFYHIMVV